MVTTTPLYTSMTTGISRRTTTPLTRPWKHSRCASLTAHCPCGVGSCMLPKMLAHHGIFFPRTPTSSLMKTKTLLRYYRDKKMTEINCTVTITWKVFVFVLWSRSAFGIHVNWAEIVMAIIWIFILWYIREITNWVICDKTWLIHYRDYSVVHTDLKKDIWITVRQLVYLLQQKWTLEQLCFLSSLYAINCVKCKVLETLS